MLRFAPATVQVERKAGNIYLRSPQKLAPYARCVTEWLVQWSDREPTRIFLAERKGEGWRKLSFRWGIFFLFCAVANEILWRSLARMFPPEQADSYWAGFKLFGFSGLIFIFTLTQMPLITRHSLEEQAQDK